MKPKLRSDFEELRRWCGNTRLSQKRIIHRLEEAMAYIPAGAEGLHAALNNSILAAKRLKKEVDLFFDSEGFDKLRELTTPLEPQEVTRVLQLNRQLKNINRHLKSVAVDITPRLETKLADPTDPMYDYEIYVQFDFILREDDPDFQEDDDNIMTSRTEPLAGSFYFDEEEDHRDACHDIPDGLHVDSHCWLFKSLYGLDNGPESPRLSFKDCARVGQIWVDVQIWQQYIFEADGSHPCEWKRSLPANHWEESPPPNLLTSPSEEASADTLPSGSGSSNPIQDEPSERWAKLRHEGQAYGERHRSLGHGYIKVSDFHQKPITVWSISSGVTHQYEDLESMMKAGWVFK